MQESATSDVPLVRLLQSTVGLVLRELEPGLVERGWHDVRPSWGFVMGRMDLGPTTVNDLAEYLDVSKQAASKTVEHMEQQGLVRLVPFPGDRRKKIIEYTDVGRRFRQDTLEIVRQIECSWAALIGNEGLTALRTHLTQILHAGHGSTRPASTPATVH